ncbi:MAG TPA: phosphonatase-like hydrolase [Pseudonocardia sp.]
MATIELACLDMAGTTVSDDGVVERAFTAAAGEVGLEPGTPPFVKAMTVVRETMGQAKIEVFRLILGDEDTAQQANAAFERAYADLLASGAVQPLPGAVEVLGALRDAGVKVCLTTGFAPATRDALLAHLGWKPLVDLALSPADAGRGRPWPDMIQLAARTLGVRDPAAVAVVGDTPSDVKAGVAAGAAVVAGVLTGTGSREELESAGATHVLATIAELPGVLGLAEHP